MKEDFTIEAASPENEAAILELLTATDLPHDGVSNYLGGFLIARDTSGEVIGCAGLEKYGTTGLLRSVAVSPNLQKSGLGSKLVETIVSDAKKNGVEEIVLLTTTARDFFEHRFSFVETTRAEYDEKLKDSPEWNLPRCSSACIMKLCI